MASHCVTTRFTVALTRTHRKISKEHVERDGRGTTWEDCRKRPRLTGSMKRSCCCCFGFCFVQVKLTSRLALAHWETSSTQINTPARSSRRGCFRNSSVELELLCTHASGTLCCFWYTVYKKEIKIYIFFKKVVGVWYGGAGAGGSGTTSYNGGGVTEGHGSSLTRWRHRGTHHCVHPPHGYCSTIWLILYYNHIAIIIKRCIRFYSRKKDL